MELIIREAAEQDLPSIISLFSQPDMDQGQVITVAPAREFFQKTKQYPFFKVYIAVLNNEVVGV